MMDRIYGKKAVVLEAVEKSLSGLHLIARGVDGSVVSDTIRPHTEQKQALLDIVDKNQIDDNFKSFGLIDREGEVVYKNDPRLTLKKDKNDWVQAYYDGELILLVKIVRKAGNETQRYAPGKTPDEAAEYVANLVRKGHMFIPNDWYAEQKDRKGNIVRGPHFIDEPIFEQTPEKQ